MRRILIVSDAWKPQVNGVVRTYEHLGAELERLGHTVKIIGPGDFPRRLPMPGYREIELALAPYRRLAAMIESFEPTTLHIGTEGPLGWAARRYAMKKNIRFTTAYHTQFPDYVAKRAVKFFDPLEKYAHRAALFLMKRFHKPSAGIVTTTPSLNRQLTQQGFTAPLHVMNRGVPSGLFTPGSSPLFKDLPRPVALYVGRIAIEKNIGEFLSMPWKGSKIVVGDGPALPALKAQYPDVVFTGKKTGEELVDHYRAADIFAFPSKTDTFGIVILEALSCGLPVAAYDATGPKDILTDERLGYTDRNLSKAVEKAMNSTGDAAFRHDHVQKNYLWLAIARRFIEILDETNT